jgi:hypothetical protein
VTVTERVTAEKGDTGFGRSNSEWLGGFLDRVWIQGLKNRELGLKAFAGQLYL